jgi:hypothetical protein
MRAWTPMNALRLKLVRCKRWTPNDETVFDKVERRRAVA